MSIARRSPLQLLVGGLAVVVLAAGSTVALATATGAFHYAWVAPDGRCSAPTLRGSVVDVMLTDMGPMMSAWGGEGTMRVLTNRDRVPATVSLRVANTGSLVHELVVLPPPEGQGIGQRPVGPDGRVAETGSVGEASRTCGAGAGDRINPGALGWVTLILRPGTYELICNEPGHYAAGMSARLAVS